MVIRIFDVVKKFLSSDMIKILSMFHAAYIFCISFAVQYMSPYILQLWITVIFLQNASGFQTNEKVLNAINDLH